MLPEKTYWIILILGFLVFSILTWSVLIPYEILEYDLGVNLFTSSIFMVLTVVFLSFLTGLRERKYWKSVKEKVYRRIGSCLNTILVNCIMISNKHPELASLSKANHDGLVKLMENIANVKTIALSKESLQLLSYNPRAWSSLFREQYGYLDDIEIKYSKYLEPEIISSIMNVEMYLNNISICLATIWIMSKGKMNKNIQKSTHTCIQNIEYYIYIIIKEIYKIYKMGIFPEAPPEEATVVIKL